jgi:hypothetical protein
MTHKPWGNLYKQDLKTNTYGGVRQSMVKFTSQGLSGWQAAAPQHYTMEYAMTSTTE